MNAIFSTFSKDQSSKETATDNSNEKQVETDDEPKKLFSTNPFDELEDDEEDKDSTRSREGSAVVENAGNPFGEDPLISDMEMHWRELSDLMEMSLTDPFALQEFKDHLKVIAEILHKELEQSTSNGCTSECLELFLSENMLEKAYLFSSRQRIYCSEVRLALLNFSTSLLSCSGPPLFIHQQVLRPLNRLLRACEMAHDHWLDSSLVTLLHQMCILIQENESLLDLFFTVGGGQVPSKFIVFTLLVRYIHDLSEVGMRARDAMLLCLSIAGRSPHSSLCDFIITYTEFCQVLAAGLSATYSQLPLVVSLSCDEWESPLASLEQNITEMKKFMQALSYCNSVLQMAPLVVSQACIALIKNGFLKQVLGPALLQSSPEEATTATGYLTLFLLNISNVQLMRVFLQFLMTGKCDGNLVLNTLIQNIASDSQQLSSMTLELFHLLLDLNCEDVMLELILKFLLPGKHVMPNQLPTIGNRDLYCVAARKFLSLTPSCCTKAEKILVDKITHSPHSSRSSSPPLTASPARQDSTHQLANPVTPDRLDRVRRDSTSSTCSATSSTGPTTTALQQNHTQPIAGVNGNPLPAISNMQSSLSELINSSIMFNILTPDHAYQAYLEESRVAIEGCARACKCWSYEYDRCVEGEGFQEKGEQTTGLKDRGANGAITCMSDNRLITTVQRHEDDHFKKVSNSPDTLSYLPVVDGQLPVVPSSPTHSSSSLEPSSHLEASPSVSPSISPRVSRRSVRRLLDSTSSPRFSDIAGLFIKVLFERLSRLFQNTPIINVLLIKVITRLGHYPHPLLRSLLLNHQLVLRPGVPNLFNVLQDIKQLVDRMDRDRENFELRLARARKTLIYNAAVKNKEIDEAMAKKISSQMRECSRTDSRMSDRSDPDQPTVSTRGTSRVEEKSSPPPIQRRRARTEGSQGLEKLRRSRKKMMKVTINMVYAILMFSEFLKELAALSMEHAIINPQLLQIEKKEDDYVLGVNNS